MEKICSNLSKELRKRLGKRSLSLRKEDKIKIMRGKNKGKETKVMSVDRKTGRVILEKITHKKADGTESAIPFNASNLQIIEIEEKDERRIKKALKKEAKTEEKKKVS